MRPLASAPLALATLLVAACGGSTPAEVAPATCEAPTGCARVARVGSACQCQQWQVVSVEPVPVKFLVVGVIYSFPGNQSAVSYGHWEGDLGILAASSDLGARWQSVVHAADGRATVATLGAIDVGPGTFAPLARVTPATAALAQPSNQASGYFPSLDVPDPEQDEILVWLNPAAAVSTDFVGGRTVSWSWRSDCGYPGGCQMPWVFPVSAGYLTGRYTTSNPYVQAILDLFDAEDRATLLAHDVRFDPAGLDPARLAGDVRFQHVVRTELLGGQDLTVPVSWTPCDGPLSDDAFAPLFRASHPFGNRSSLEIQYGALATSATCAPQSPGFRLSTRTPGCSMGVDVFVDRRFGTILTVPTAPADACTR